MIGNSFADGISPLTLLRGCGGTAFAGLAEPCGGDEHLGGPPTPLRGCGATAFTGLAEPTWR